MSKPFAVGAYVHQRLNLAANGKAHGRNAKASNRTWEIRPSGIIGGLRKRSHGGNENPTRNRKSGLGNPPPTAGASEFYPNHLSFVQAQDYRVALKSRAIRKLNHKSETVR